MKKEIADLWVAALRSGKYAQTKEQLRVIEDGAEPIGFCCLGVLCDLHDPEFWDGETYRMGDEEESGVLPSPVKSWAGMKTTDGQFGAHNLARRNDNGESFSRLADAIEANWESL